MFGGNLFVNNKSIFEENYQDINNTILTDQNNIKSNKIYTKDDIDNIVKYFKSLNNLELDGNKILIESLKNGNIIGEGEYGLVYGFEHYTKKYCIKIEKNKLLSNNINSIKKLNNELIVRSLDIQNKNNIKFSIYEQGDKIKIDDKINNIINMIMIKKYLLDLNNNYKDNYILFGDIKIDNMIIIDNVIKLIDIDNYKIISNNDFNDNIYTTFFIPYLTCIFDKTTDNNSSDYKKYIYNYKYYDLISLLFTIILYVNNITNNIIENIMELIMINSMLFNYKSDDIIYKYNNISKQYIKYRVYHKYYNKIKYSIYNIDNNITHYKLELITLHILSLIYLWYINIINNSKDILNDPINDDFDYINDMKDFIKDFGFENIYDFNTYDDNLSINNDKFNLLYDINELAQNNIKNMNNCEDIKNQEYFDKRINNKLDKLNKITNSLNKYDKMYIHYIINHKDKIIN